MTANRLETRTPLARRNDSAYRRVKLSIRDFCRNWLIEYTPVTGSSVLRFFFKCFEALRICPSVVRMLQLRGNGSLSGFYGLSACLGFVKFLLALAIKRKLNTRRLF
ncbi:b2.3 [Tranosema rostrale ichnovirus]|nr:b2.3 [Tranosema rostrale ichnovirus]